MSMARNQQKPYKKFLIFLSIWVLFGLVALTSAGVPIGYGRFNDAYFFIKRQILYGLLPGLLMFFIILKIPYDIWRRFSWLVYIFSLILLIAVFIPGIGQTINFSRSWLHVGLFSFQPGESAKLGLIIIMSALLAQQKRNLEDWQNGLLPVLAIAAPAIILVLKQPDLGTLIIIMMILFALLYMAGTPIKFLSVMAIVAVLVLIVFVRTADYRMNRLVTFLHPELDPQGFGYQINQAFLAVGSGGMWGLGLGQSRQKYQYLPEVQADSIFAIIAEEFGFIFAGGFVILILLTGLQGLKIAKGAPDNFGRLLVGGITVWFVWQSFLNIGAIVGVLPLTGVPLPFVSHGGSALLMAMSAAGIVVRVGKES